MFSPLNKTGDLNPGLFNSVKNIFLGILAEPKFYIQIINSFIR